MKINEIISESTNRSFKILSSMSEWMYDSILNLKDRLSEMEVLSTKNNIGFDLSKMDPEW